LGADFSLPLCLPTDFKITSVCRPLGNYHPVAKEKARCSTFTDAVARQMLSDGRLDAVSPRWQTRYNAVYLEFQTEALVKAE